MAVCLCCGQEILADISKQVRLGRMQLRLYELVRAAGPAGIEVRKVQFEMYSDRFDGGPENLSRVVSVTKNTVNRKIKLAGWTILGGKGQGTRYRLQRLV